MKTTTVNKKEKEIKPLQKKQQEKKPKPGTYAALMQGLNYAKKHPIQFID